MIKKILQYVYVYLLLIPILILGLWIFFLGREVFLGMMGVYYVGESLSRGYQVEFYDRMVTLLLGLGWLILFVTAEELLRRQALRPKKMLIVYSRIMGIISLTALALDTMMLLFLSNMAAVGWVRWLVVIVELVFGVLFVFLGWSKRSPFREKLPPGVYGEPALTAKP